MKRRGRGAGLAGLRQRALAAACGERGSGAERRVSRVDDEQGAVLILALMFLVVIALMVGGLATWTSNSLGDTLTFSQERSAQYAAEQRHAGCHPKFVLHASGGRGLRPRR